MKLRKAEVAAAAETIKIPSTLAPLPACGRGKSALP